jgi:hypothetical protein
MPADPNKPEGSIDFEWTDLQTARDTLDTLPAGIGRVEMQSPDYWQSRRRRPTSADKALTGRTLEWLMMMPPSQRPHATCERYPRIVNRIAENWNQASDRRATLESLLRDDRGNRQGLPADVRREIETLLKHNG